MKFRSHKIALAAVAAVAAVSLAACGSSTTATDNPSDGSTSTAPDLGLVSSGTLTVCSDVPYAPFEDFDTSAPSGFKGFDVDIVQKIADDLGLKLQILDEDFDGLQSGLTLNAGTCDLVVSAMTITADRAKNLDFTEGYFDADQSLLVPTGSPITGIADLAGKKVAVQKGTTGEDYARAHATGATIVDFPDDPGEFQALKAGQVDAILQDLPVNVAHQQSGGFSVVETYKTNEEYGMAAKKGSDALIAAVNGELDKMKADGDYKTIYDKYFATN